ncbi:MAG: methyltransferase domain-containing protein [Chloroflexaceae bacterium]|nr:methyltransferase domain-containing protein [Chloroflexaceae bacterium]
MSQHTPDVPQPAPPGAHLDPAKMPGHWLLAQLGKRVLRPGGRELTLALVNALAIQPTDDLVEFAPGLGFTASLTTAQPHASYTGIERDATAAAHVSRVVQPPRDRCIVGTAEHTGLPDASASVVYGEAMLTMQTATQKARIVQEAARLLRPGGRYAIHELSLVPDTLASATKAQIEHDLAQVIHVGARPLTSAEWRELLHTAGLVVQHEQHAPMHLLEPQRMLADEGLWRTLRIGFNLLRNPIARQRVHAMRKAFQTHATHLGAILLVAHKPQ